MANLSCRRFSSHFWAAAFFLTRAVRSIERKIRGRYYKTRRGLAIDRTADLGSTHLDLNNISIGRGSYVKSGEILSGNATVRIGEFCAIGNNVAIKARTHDRQSPTKLTPGHTNQRIEKDIVIGDRVWIGDNVFIREGIVIGDDVIIGANSVVTRSVPKGAVVGGVPARNIA